MLNSAKTVVRERDGGDRDSTELHAGGTLEQRGEVMISSEPSVLEPGDVSLIDSFDLAYVVDPRDKKLMSAVEELYQRDIYFVGDTRGKTLKTVFEGTTIGMRERTAIVETLRYFGIELG